MTLSRRAFLRGVAEGVVLAPACAQAATSTAEEAVTWGVHVSLAPTWLDPGETSASITSYMFLHAIHDAVVKRMPGDSMAAALAETWTMSADGVIHEFLLRDGPQFHNGAPVTAADVKFSFERYRGISAARLHGAVQRIEVIGSRRVRFMLKQPWPDFMTFYCAATGAGWVVPKNYLARVGEDGFRRAPIGAGPYRFVRFTPGVELVLESFDRYWRKPPVVKRLILKVLPDEATRVAALRRGEIDIAYAISATHARSLAQSTDIAVKAVDVHAVLWVYFAEQWDPQSPWHDRRVRLAASHAINRLAISQMETLGHSKATGSIVPSTFDGHWPVPAHPYDPRTASELLAQAGYPNGFDGGDYFCDVAYASMAEAVINDLQTVGIRTRLHALERAAFFKLYAERKLRNLVQGGSGAPGSAATRLESFVAKDGAYAFGAYPDFDRLFREHDAELDPRKRRAMLHRLQQIVHERVMFAPIYELSILHGVGARVQESALGRIPGYPFSAPYEDVQIAARRAPRI